MSGRVDRDRLDTRTRRLLEARIVPTLLCLPALGIAGGRLPRPVERVLAALNLMA